MQPTETPQTRRMNSILKRPANKLCFECGAKHPRWGSTNLGVLFCIRCAGFFRSLGVHICKVKSTNMDVWDDAMIHVIDRIGNENGRLLYEARLPAGYARFDQFADNITVERAIKQKYATRTYWDEDYDQKYLLLIERGTPSPLSDVGTGHSRSRSDISSNQCSSLTSPVTCGHYQGRVCSPVSTSKSGTRGINSEGILQGSVVGVVKPLLNDTSFFDVPPKNAVAAPVQQPAQSTNTVKKGANVFDDFFSVPVCTSCTADNSEQRGAIKPVPSSGLDLFAPTSSLPRPSDTSVVRECGGAQSDCFIDDILGGAGPSSHGPSNRTTSHHTADSQHNLDPFAEMSVKSTTIGNSSHMSSNPPGKQTDSPTRDAMTAALSGLGGEGSGRVGVVSGSRTTSEVMYQNSIHSGVQNGKERAW